MMENSIDIDEVEDDSESVASRDFSDDFSCEVLNPDIRLKFKKRVQGLSLGAHLTFKDPRQHGLKDKGLVLTVRPFERREDLRGKLLNKVSVDAKEGEIVWSMGKMQVLDILKVKVAAGFNLRTKTPLWQYRVTTKWNQDEHRAVHKLPVHTGWKTQLVPNFDLNYSLPSVGGFTLSVPSRFPEVDWESIPCQSLLPHKLRRASSSLPSPSIAAALQGSAGHNAESEGGCCHLKMPRVDFVIRLDDIAPKAQPRQQSQEVESLLITEDGADIEEIPIIKETDHTWTPQAAPKPKWSSQNLFMRKHKERSPPSLELAAPVKEPSSSRPVPWGRNPLKLPWILPDQWYAAEQEASLNDSKPDSLGRRQDRKPTWGLDASSQKIPEK